MELIKAAVCLSDEISVLESHTLRVQLICRELQLVQKSVEKFEEKIAAAFKAHEDHAIFASFPGAGPVLAPRLLAGLGSERERFATPHQLQRFSGIAPVTKQSGATRYIHRRHRCPVFLKQTFHEYAQESVLHSRWAAAFYLHQRQKGCGHHTAVRALAYKWQRVIWKCWQTKCAYNDELYEAALKEKGSPVAALFDQVELGKSPLHTARKNLKKSVAGLPQR